MNAGRMLGRARLVWRAFGARGLVRRGVYVAQLRSGLLRRRLPAVAYGALEPITWRHRFDLAEVRGRYRDGGLTERALADAVRRCDDLAAGRLSFYGGHLRDVGSPPRWHALPDGGAELPMTHWTSASDDLAEGDIKDVCEPSRFGVTFACSRAFVATGDDRFVEQWWQLFEHWLGANPPNIGPNWRCGQESSLRAIAVTFGLSAFGEHAASTPARLDAAHRFLAATEARVAPTVGYALSQRNNHAISELVFLLSLPGGAAPHRQRLLREALADQWYADGSYAQQSPVYQRLAVHTLVWLLHVQPELDGATASAVRRALATSRDFLARIGDAASGRLPNSGANDGALLLDLDDAPRWDVRPTLALLGERRGGDHESSAWLPAEVLGLGAGVTAGTPTAFVTMAGPRSLLLTHIGQGRHRAGDDDQQAVELIIDGEPVVLDPGTFRYSGRSPWRQPFTGRRAHSMATADATVGDARLGRFLHEAMPAATVVRHDRAGSDEVLVASRVEGDTTLTRAVVRRDDRFVVFDSVMGGSATVSWLLPAGTVLDESALHVPGATGAMWSPAEPAVVSRSSDDPTSGWWSPWYGERHEATRLQIALADGQVAAAGFAPAGVAVLSPADVMDHFGGDDPLSVAVRMAFGQKERCA